MLCLLDIRPNDVNRGILPKLTLQDQWHQQHYWHYKALQSLSLLSLLMAFSYVTETRTFARFTRVGISTSSVASTGTITVCMSHTVSLRENPLQPHQTGCFQIRSS